ncbi:hypothetical protein NHX12_017285, partial [Muraenolepis orangiensis]
RSHAKMLLPKPRMALVNVPVMQLTHVPVLTDISVSAEVLLPVSVETQTFSFTKAKSTIAAQTDVLCLSQIPCSGLSVSAPTSRQTQTRCPASQARERVQTDELNSNSMSDNQTQTMTLLHDLENILSDSMSGHQGLDATAGCGPGLDPVQDQPTGIDFDFEEFLNTVHIQTQTEESELRGLGSDTPLESLDFLLLDELEQSTGHSRTQATDLELEMFDTHTQTDLNFLLSDSSHMPLGSILRHSSFSMSTESSDTETQTDLPPPPIGLSPQLPVPHIEQARLLSSTETQTIGSQADGLGHLFLTSNETQTVMDDFLSADLAWNMESHF